MRLKWLILALIIFFSTTYFFASDWILAATPFAISTESNSSFGLLASTSEQIPKLILQEFADSETRQPSVIEIQQRELKKLYSKKNTLVARLKSATEDRNKEFLSSKDNFNKKKNLQKKDDLINEINLEIQEINILIQNLLQEIEKGDSFIYSELEPIYLYNNNSEMLLENDSITQLEEKISSSNINGLITGKITAFGDYIEVEAIVYAYPGKINLGSVSATGSIKDIVSLSKNLSNKLKPIITNENTVSLIFNIEPQEAKEKANIIIDNKVLKLSAQEEIIIPSGKQTITISAEGYYEKTFTWNYSKDEYFCINVALEKIETIPVNISEESNLPGQLYINALPVGETPALINIPQGIILGEFSLDNQTTEKSTEDKSTLTVDPIFFTANITEQNNLEQLNLRLKSETLNISQRIEKRRRSMYNSYSAFIVSLIPTFFSYGMYINKHNGWVMGSEDESKAKTWEIVSNSSIALSCGLGVNFIIQLGRYISAVDDVLPNNISE